MSLNYKALLAYGGYFWRSGRSRQMDHTMRRRRIELLIRRDIPINKLQWKLLGDYIESQFAIENTKHLIGNVGIGFTWRTQLNKDTAMTWSKLANEIVPRVMDTRETLEILDSKIIQTRDYPYMELVLEGE